MCRQKEREGLSSLGQRAFDLVRGDREEMREWAMEGISQATRELEATVESGEGLAKALAAIEAASISAGVAMERDRKSTDLIFGMIDRKRKRR